MWRVATGQQLILGARRRPRSDGDVAHDSTTVCRKKGGLMARDRQPPGDSEATAAAWCVGNSTYVA
uniref:Uncharacterized protein n=1 Tax=Oryza sativa subsp. indica TaxID=39946 RepID=A0A679B989_ORYSI|nr:hypothetical protein [Oryza sativa Indica Group]BBD82410.1 hypothetical protein [Oryza sativa Indica Group]